MPKTDLAEYNRLLGYVVNNVALDVSDDFLMAPTHEDLKLTATINHSCDPNSGFSDTITIVAMKDISPGEEVTWDYACSQTDFEQFKCKCKTEHCRGVIKPDDWKKPELQAKYKGYFSPYLKAKIEMLS